MPKAVIYIGKKSVKRDNVMNSGLIWGGPGAIVENVPDNVAATLCNMHKDIWVDVTDLGPEAREEMAEAIRSQALPAGALVTAAIPVVDPNAVPPAGATHTAPYDVEAVTQAIRMLGTPDQNPDAFTQQGKPRVKAVEEILGYDVNAAAVEECWAAVQDDRDAIVAGAA